MQIQSRGELDILQVHSLVKIKESFEQLSYLDYYLRSFKIDDYVSLGSIFSLFSGDYVGENGTDVDEKLEKIDPKSKIANLPIKSFSFGHNFKTSNLHCVYDEIILSTPIGDFIFKVGQGGDVFTIIPPCQIPYNVWEYPMYEHDNKFLEQQSIVFAIEDASPSNTNDNVENTSLNDETDNTMFFYYDNDDLWNDLANDLYPAPDYYQVDRSDEGEWTGAYHPEWDDRNELTKLIDDNDDRDDEPKETHTKSPNKSVPDVVDDAQTQKIEKRIFNVNDNYFKQEIEPLINNIPVQDLDFVANLNSISK